MDGSGGNQEMIVLLCRDAVDEFFRVKLPGLLRFSQRGDHLVGVYAGLDAQIDRSIALRNGVKDIVAFVLRIVHAEILLDVLGERMHLKREVLSADGIEEVKADGELRAEARVYPFAEQRAGLGRRRILRGDLHHRAALFEQQAVLLRHAVKAQA